jgi:hypothetical protein
VSEVWCAKCVFPYSLNTSDLLSMFVDFLSQAVRLSFVGDPHFEDAREEFGLRIILSSRHSRFSLNLLCMHVHSSFTPRKSLPVMRIPH